MNTKPNNWKKYVPNKQEREAKAKHDRFISFCRDELDVTKITKKEHLEFILENLKESIEINMLNRPVIEETWTHTIWLCKYPNYVNCGVRCDGGERSRYWHDRRNTAAELRAIFRGNPDVDYIVFRCGNKRPKWTLIEGSKYRA